MPLTPEDVANKQFTSTRLKPGYDETEVDEFLDEVEAELSRLYRENDELRSRLSTVAAGSRGPAETPDTAALVQERESLAREKEAIAREKEGLSREKDGLKRDNDQLRSQLAALQRELAEARNRPAPAPVPAAAAAPQSAESATGILALAQRTADEHIAEARTQADRIISEARTRAEQLKREADDRHRQTIGALDTERVGLEQKVEKLRAFEREYRARLKSYLENQLRELDSAAAAAPGGNRTAQGGAPGSPAPSGNPAAPVGGSSPAPAATSRSPFSPGTPVGGQAPSGPPQQAGGAESSDDSRG